MPRGGARRGAGRKPSLRLMLTRESVKLAKESGTTPLQFLLSVMNDVGLPVGTRMQAAGLAAPYVHPRLSASLHGNLPTAPGADSRLRLEALLERLARSPAPLLELPAVTVDASAASEPAVS
jgi:hypothetical protein